VDIAGLGSATIMILVKEGLVREPGDFYHLRPEDFDGIKGLGAATAEKLLAAIDRSRSAELWRFIYGLGIPRVGAANAGKLAEACGTLEELAQMEEGVMARIIGPAAAGSAAKYLQRPENTAELRALAASVHPKSRPEPALAPFSGKVVVFTGALPGLTREEASALVRVAGGVLRDRVTRETNFLVVGEGPGQKLDEARKFGVTLLTADEFQRMLGRH
jgi:DNA ligase (NAD+)